IRTTSAKANVDRMKNGPRRRAQIIARSAPNSAAIMAPTQMPNHGDRSYRVNRMVDVYAPTPKNAEWPNEIRPAYPPAMFQASASPAKRKLNRTTSCRLGAMPDTTKPTQIASRMISNQENCPRFGSSGMPLEETVGGAAIDMATR